MIPSVLKDSAISNALSSVRTDLRLPNNVFVRNWVDYLFFDSRIMFHPSFISAKDVMLREEGSVVIALVNLGNIQPIAENTPQAIFLNENTSATEYISILKGDGSPLNWMFLMDRYVCASDKGSWCIYCEKENDIAVLAFNKGFSLASLHVRSLLRAESIKSISGSRETWLFDFDKLVPKWKASLAKEYAHR